MLMLVTLQQASDHVRRDTDDDDADLILKIKAASMAIRNYLKDYMLVYIPATDIHGRQIYDSADEAVYVEDSSGNYIVREEIQNAVLILIGMLYIDRDGNAYIDGKFSNRLDSISLPTVVHWLLDPIRTPTMA